MNAKKQIHIFNLKSYFTFRNALPSTINALPNYEHDYICQI
jgi:hypothetical protein